MANAVAADGEDAVAITLDLKMRGALTVLIVVSGMACTVVCQFVFRVLIISVSPCISVALTKRVFLSYGKRRCSQDAWSFNCIYCGFRNGLYSFLTICGLRSYH